MPNAARISDMHTCPAVNPGPVPHVGGPVSSGSPNVNIGYIPAARVGDTAVCVPAIDSIKAGSSNVFINHREAARIGDPTNHGGVIVAGCATVFISESAQSFALTNASKSGAPFCEECEKAKKITEELRSPPPPNEPPADAVGPKAVKPSPLAANKPAEVAKQPNPQPDDGQNNVRRAAREKVAWDFLSNQSPSASPADIESRVRGIDLDKPVQIVEVPPDAGAALDGPAKLALKGSPAGGGAPQLLLPLGGEG